MGPGAPISLITLSDRQIIYITGWERATFHLVGPDAGDILATPRRTACVSSCGPRDARRSIGSGDATKRGA
jgi:hypothetical protein